jgi:hypothetical protein
VSDVRGLDGFSGEDFRLLRGDVDADLGHGGYRYPEAPDGTAHSVRWPPIAAFDR